MKKEIRFAILSTLLCLLPCLVGLLIWDKLPDMVPTHFDFNNQPDQYSSKAFAVFGLPGIIAALNLVCIIGMNLDPKREAQSPILRKIVVLIVPVIALITSSLVYGYALGSELNIGLIICLFTGALFIVIGNYLPKCRRNFTLGIRIPWTLNSEENWNYTHRIGGFCFVIGGLLIIAAGAIGISFFFAALFVMLVVPILASYLYHRRHGDGDAEEKDGCEGEG